MCRRHCDEGIGCSLYRIEIAHKTSGLPQDSASIIQFGGFLPVLLRSGENKERLTVLRVVMQYGLRFW